ncbi:MAG: dihydrolipoyl dehydrogenase, partial [Luteimonas sp.]
LEVDVAIIGAGTAGMGAFRAAREHTQSVLLIEGGAYGTTCARVGCMPSKLLIAAADAAHHVREADGFGIRVDAPRIDGVAVMQRVRSERDRFVGFVVETVEGWPDAQRIHGNVRFTDPHTLALDDGRTVHAKRIVIATGSRTAVPDGWAEALGDRLVVNDDVFDWQDLPESVLVVGSGVIGLELGQALHRLGVRVRILTREQRIGGLTDPVVAAHARGILQDELPLLFNAAVTKVAREGQQARVDFRAGESEYSERFDFVLAAIGRKPNIEHLNLAATGIALDARGVPLTEATTAQAGESHIFLAGDVASRRMILHEAADDGRIAGDNAGRFPDVRPQPRRAGLSVVFSDPQIAIAGRSHAALVAGGAPFAVAQLDFADQGRSRVMRRNRGLIRVYGEYGTGRFLGAEMIAPDAEHLAHLLAWAVQAELSVEDMLASPFYHPVVEEGVRTALRALERELHLGPMPVERGMGPVPGA